MYETMFEKMIVLVILVVLFLLVGLTGFYFRRRLSNVELAIKDQAKVTQNILSMMNTLTSSQSTWHPSQPSHDTNGNHSPNQGNASSEMHAMAMELPIDGASFGSICGVVDLGISASSVFDAVHSMALGVPVSEAEADIEEIEEIEEIAEKPEARGQPDANAGLIVVSDTEALPDKDEGALEEEVLSDIDADEPPPPPEKDCDGVVEPRTSPDNVSGDKGGAPASYEHMKVPELRELLEKRGIPCPKNKLKKELVQLLEAATPGTEAEAVDATTL